jgi:hypothetical protein
VQGGGHAVELRLSEADGDISGQQNDFAVRVSLLELRICVGDATADGRLAGIDSRGANFNEHLATTRRGYAEINQIQDIAPTVVAEPNRTSF